MANVPVPQQLRKAYQDLTGGLMSRPNPLMIPANKFTVLQNAIMNDTDVLQKVQGYTLDGSPFPNSTDSFIRMLINYRVGDSLQTLVCAGQDDGNTNANYKVDLKQTLGNGSYNYIGHTVGTAVFTNGSMSVVGTGTNWNLHLKAGDKIGVGSQPSIWYELAATPGTATGITLTVPYNESTTATPQPYMARVILSYNTIPVGVVFNNNLIVSNGSETPISFNDSSVSKLQSPNWQLCTLLELHKNRVFGANWPAQPSGLMWTYVNDETTVDPVSFASVFPNDNGQVVQIKSFANSLLVFKDNGCIYQVVGEFDQNAQGQPAMIRKIDCPDNLGVVAGRSVCILEDNSGTQGYMRLGSKCYFLSETGIYSINSYMQCQKVSWDIQPTLSNILLKSTATATKQFSYTSQGQWDGGTITSLSDKRVLNGISTFFDNHSISTAYVGNGSASTCIASNNDVHTAYISTDRKSIRWNQWIALDNSNIDSQVIKIGVDNIVTNTYPATLLQSIDAVAIAYSSSDGHIGIVSKFYDTFGLPAAGNGSFLYFFSEYANGAWTHTMINRGGASSISGNGYYLTYNPNAVGLAVKYDGSGNPTVILGQSNQGTGVIGGTEYSGIGLSHIVRTSGTWGSIGVFAGGCNAVALNFTTDASNNLLVIAASSGRNVPYQGQIFGSNALGVQVWKSTDGGSTWSSLISPGPSLSVTGATAFGSGHVDISVNAQNEPIAVYNFTTPYNTGDTGKIVRYNTTLQTTSYLSSNPNMSLKGYSNNIGYGEHVYTQHVGEETFIFQTNYTAGTAVFTAGNTNVTGTGTKWTTWVEPGDRMKVGTDSEADYGIVQTVSSDNAIILTAPYAGTTVNPITPVAYISNRTNTVNSGSFVVANTYYCNSGGMSQNGNIVATISFGLNANEIVLRRTTLFGQFTTPILSDATLQDWSTYIVTDPVSNGNTILFEVGVSSGAAMPDNQMFTIIPGSIISTTESDIYVEARISFTLGTFASASVQSLTLNYVATGVDAKLPFGYVFNNEMYLSVTAQGGTGNNEMIFLDRMGSWGTFTAGSCAMARYNQQLYVGDSASGNIYKFRQGYDFNGNSYDLIAITKEDLLGSIELRKEVYKVYCIYETQNSGTFTFSYRFDNFLNPNSSNTTGWIDTVVDQTKGAVVEVPNMGGTPCSSIQFKIEQDDADVQIGIIGFIILYSYENVR